MLKLPELLGSAFGSAADCAAGDKLALKFGLCDFQLGLDLSGFPHQLPEMRIDTHARLVAVLSLVVSIPCASAARWSPDLGLALSRADLPHMHDSHYMEEMIGGVFFCVLILAIIRCIIGG